MFFFVPEICCCAYTSCFQILCPLSERVMAHHGWKSDCKVYVGGLRDDANRYDLEDAFAKIGKVSIDLARSFRNDFVPQASVKTRP
jgi:hypothetical protein